MARLATEIVNSNPWRGEDATIAKPSDFSYWLKQAIEGRQEREESSEDEDVKAVAAARAAANVRK